jgi:hypothetical protein
VPNVSCISQIGHLVPAHRSALNERCGIDSSLLGAIVERQHPLQSGQPFWDDLFKAGGNSWCALHLLSFVDHQNQET